MDKYDSFITHNNQFSDALKAKHLGVDIYNAEQADKVKQLHTLLNYLSDADDKTDELPELFTDVRCIIKEGFEELG